MAVGAVILGEVLVPHGFAYARGPQGVGSGGRYAQGRFFRNDQLIDFHLRLSLGMVTYTWADDVLDHRDLLRSPGVSGAYPGFSDDPLDGFRHLAVDLAGPLAWFVDGGSRTPFDLALAMASTGPARRLP